MDKFDTHSDQSKRIIEQTKGIVLGGNRPIINNHQQVGSVDVNQQKSNILDQLGNQLNKSSGGSLQIARKFLFQYLDLIKEDQSFQRSILEKIKIFYPGFKSSLVVWIELSEP